MSAAAWWQIYGPFSEGEDSYPHMGQVIAHYSKMRGLKAWEIAERLSEKGWKVGERRVEQLLSEGNVNDPQQISRRKLLGQILAIPPILLGLAQVPTLLKGLQTPDSLHDGQNQFDGDNLLRYQAVLTAYWGNFYAGSAQHNAEGIQRWRSHVESLAKDASGESQRQLLTLLCRFDQLAAVVAKDNSDLTMAMKLHNQSIRIARELDDPELLAASLFRRARTLLHQERLGDATKDLKLAANFSRRARPNLRGYILQMAGEVVTRLPVTSETERLFRHFTDEAGKIIRSGNHDDDGSYVQLNLAGFQQDRARALLRLNKVEDALEAITLAERAQAPHMTRWQTEMLILRASAYNQSNEPEWACQQLEEALSLAKVSGSQSQKKKIVETFGSIASRHPKQARVRQLATQLRA